MNAQRKKFLNRKIIRPADLTFYETFAYKETDNKPSKDENGMNDLPSLNSSGVHPKRRFSTSHHWYRNVMKRYILINFCSYGDSEPGGKSAKEPCIKEMFTAEFDRNLIRAAWIKPVFFPESSHYRHSPLKYPALNSRN